MNNVINSAEIINRAIGTAFGIFQAVVLAVLFGAVKIFFEHKKLKADMDSAFEKIRDLERMAYVRTEARPKGRSQKAVAVEDSIS